MADLPTGTVTFLFTDIEGSTKLLQRLGQDYRAVRDRHAAIIRSAIEAEGGRELSTAGDSFFAVFRSAGGAVRAAVVAQRELHDHRWPPGAALRVRMGIHTGEGTLGGEDYVGIDVNRAARIMDAGHGGQVILSGATRGLAERELPPGTTVRALGAHRLKDLVHPEELFDLVIDGLPSDFPAPRTLDARPNNIPAQLTTFVGRTEELAEVERLLEVNRLVTLTGPGGSGKTRLALEVASRTLSGYKDGAFFVDLSSVTDPALVSSSLAAELGVQEVAGRPILDVVRDHLRDRELLLVVDNLEQILEAAPVLEGLLMAAPKLRVLATSREVLSIRGEQEYPVPPLHPPQLERLLAVLTAGPRTLPERQRTLRGAIAWSHDLLEDAERALFARLAVFAGGWTLDAAEAVADPASVGLDPLDALASLVDRSLTRRTDPNGEPRFGMLETIREFAAERLEESSQGDELRRRHAEHYVDLAVTAEPHLTGEDQGRWLDRCELEHANIRAALRWAIDAGKAERAQEAAGALWRFLPHRRHPDG